MTRFAFKIALAMGLGLGLALGPGAEFVWAQVILVSGGLSSLDDVEGGSVTMHSLGYDFTLSAGVADGHLLEGGHAIKSTPHGTYIFGDDRIDFRLPTDVFDTSHYLLARGVGFSGIRHDFDIVSFAGLMAVSYDSPFFSGAKTSSPAGILFVRRKLNPRWELFSDTVASSKLTQIEALQWTPAKKTEVAFAVGAGANQPFAAASITMERPRFDLLASYVAAGNQFRRIAASLPALAEPDRENLQLVYRAFPDLILTGSRQNFLEPLTNTSFASSNSPNARSSIDQGSATWHWLGTQINGSIYHSTYDQPGYPNASNHSVALSANRDFTNRVHWSASYLASRPRDSNGTESLISTFTETLTPRFSINENVIHANGNTSVNFGGQFLSNILTVSATYETYYVPSNNAQPFEQELSLDVKFKIKGRLLLHTATFVDPTGHLRYTADANSVYSHDRIAHPKEHYSLGRYVIHGCVVDTDGTPVEGAAVMVDEAPLYTDSNGCFQLRESSPRTHRLRVVMSEFLVGGNWQVVTMPTTITSTTEELSQEIRMIVVLRKVREISSAPANETPLPFQPAGQKLQ